MAHVPSSAEWKDGSRWQQVTSHDHSTYSLPTISRQQHHLPRFLTVASRVVMAILPPNDIMTNIKYLLAINERNSTPEAVYICLRMKKKGWSPGNLLIPSKRPTDLYSSLWPWLTKPSEDASGHPVRMPSCRYDRWIKNPLCVENRVSIHLVATWTTGYARRQHWRCLWENFTFYFDSVTSEDGHTFPKSIIW